MADTELLKQRLQAITQERKVQEKIETMKRELEVDRILLRQMKRRALRERWLLEGSMSSSTESEIPEQYDVNNRLAEAQNLQQRINRRQLEIEHLELTTQQSTMLKPLASPLEDKVQVLKSAPGEDVICGNDTVAMAPETDGGAVEVRDTPELIFNISSDRTPKQLTLDNDVLSTQSKMTGALSTPKEWEGVDALNVIWNNESLKCDRGLQEDAGIGNGKSNCRETLDITTGNALDIENSRRSSNTSFWTQDQRKVENTNHPQICSSLVNSWLKAGKPADENSEVCSEGEVEEGGGRLCLEPAACVEKEQDVNSFQLNQDNALKQPCGQVAISPTLYGKVESLHCECDVIFQSGINFHRLGNLDTKAGMNNTIAVEDSTVGSWLKEQDLPAMAHSVVPEGDSREVSDGIIKAELVLLTDGAEEIPAVEQREEAGSRAPSIHQEKQTCGSEGEEGLVPEPAVSLTSPPADNIDLLRRNRDPVNEGLQMLWERSSQLRDAEGQDILDDTDQHPLLPKLGEGAGPDLQEGAGPDPQEGVGSDLQEGVGPDLREGVGGDLQEGAGGDLQEGVGPDPQEGVGGDLQEGVGPDPQEGVGSDLGEGLGSDLQEGTGPDLQEGAGHDLQEGVGTDLGEGVGTDLQEGVGPDPQEQVGSDPQEGVGSDLWEDVGTDPQEGAGPDLQEGAGGDLQEGTGPDPQEWVGGDPQEGAGPDPQEWVGTDPQEGAGPDPQEGAGGDLQEGAGPDPQEGVGTDPQEGVGSDPGEGLGSDLQEGTGPDLQEGAGHDLQEGVGTDPQEGAGTDLGEGAGTDLQEGVGTELWPLLLASGAGGDDRCTKQEQALPTTTSTSQPSAPHRGGANRWEGQQRTRQQAANAEEVARHKGKRCQCCAVM